MEKIYPLCHWTIVTWSVAIYVGHYLLFYVRIQLETVLLKICLALAERLKSCTFYTFVELSLFAQLPSWAESNSFSTIAWVSFTFIHWSREREKTEEYLDLERSKASRQLEIISYSSLSTISAMLINAIQSTSNSNAIQMRCNAHFHSLSNSRF